MSTGAMVPQTGLRGSGVLVPVIGSPEAGKGLIIAAARHAYAGNRAVIFPRRIVAGTGAPGHQDHAVISPAEFDDLSAGGAFAVSWQSRGTHYAIPATLGEEVDAGRVVVVDVSRKVVTTLQRRFPRVHVVYITKNPGNLDGRAELSANPNEGDLLQALWNASSRPRPSPVSVIDNSGGAGEAVLEFQTVLASYASPDA